MKLHRPTGNRRVIPVYPLQLIHDLILGPALLREGLHDALLFLCDVALGVLDCAGIFGGRGIPHGLKHLIDDDLLVLLQHGLLLQVVCSEGVRVHLRPLHYHLVILSVNLFHNN